MFLYVLSKTYQTPLWEACVNERDAERFIH